MNYQNILKTKEDYRDMRKACEISVEILRELKAAVWLGVSPKDIDDLAGELCVKNKVKSSFLGVPGPKMPFPANCCVMVNSETVHAIPYSTTPFKAGDVVKVDFGIIYNGFNTDHGVTVGLGELNDRRKALISTVELSVDKAVEYAVEGNSAGDVSHILGEIAALGDFDSIWNFAGHGIGKNIHYAPSIPFFGEKGTGEKFIKGMVVCIENWITDGDASLKLENDGWTLKTKDGSYSAMSEHMVIIGEKEPEVLTLLT